MVRLLTYNVHRCLGIDGDLSPGRVADAIAEAAPDIVLLQELDVMRKRSGAIDQAADIARRLGMDVHFHPSLRQGDESYGNAVLTSHPSRIVRAGALPGLATRNVEPRGALWAAIHVPGGEVNVVCTHLGLRGTERLGQVDCLLGKDWLGSPACRDPVILGGDFNAVPQSRAYRRLAAALRDAQEAARPARPRPTFPSRLPMLRLDHVFLRGIPEVSRAEPLRTPLARVASDHLPLLVEFRLGAARPAGSQRPAAR